MTRKVSEPQVCLVFPVLLIEVGCLPLSDPGDYILEMTPAG